MYRMSFHVFQLFAVGMIISTINGRSFTIDFENNTFLKNGKPYQYISGSMHYSRVPRHYWKDRLLKLPAAGLDAVQLYVPWNVHEPQPHVYDFTGQQNISAFLYSVQEVGLDALVRAGPYICGEWEYGGLPAWLLSDNMSMIVRSMDKKYIAAVDRWMSTLFTYIKPHLYANGGPVIMIQIENEYGSYRSIDCGHDYMAHLHDIARHHLGYDVVLYTTDGNGLEMLECGTTDDTYATVDFGPTSDVTGAFDAMRKWNPRGPLVNSECYTGWLDHWKGSHAHGDTELLLSTLHAIRLMNASVNMYMFEGGTSFGYMNGADPVFSVCTTSYDYDAPLSEAGDITEKYMAIRNFTSQFRKLPPVPPNIPKAAYGKILMRPVASVADMVELLSNDQPLLSIYPLNMEQSGKYYGFVLYRHILKKDFMTSELSVSGVRDRGYIIINKELRGIVDRSSSTAINTYALTGMTLDILVENQGRINYGSQINDNKKGIVSNVTFDGTILNDWSMHVLNFSKFFDILEDLSVSYRFSHYEYYHRSFMPSLFIAEFTINESVAKDTFLQMCGWFKCGQGQAFINGFNVGRYWPVAGPQVTLYVPAVLLKTSPFTNRLVVVELESCPSSRDPAAADTVEFVDQPTLNARCFR